MQDPGREEKREGAGKKTNFQQTPGSLEVGGVPGKLVQPGLKFRDSRQG